MMEMLVSVGEGSSVIERSVSKPSSSFSICMRHNAISGGVFFGMPYPLPYKVYWGYIEGAIFVPFENL